MNVSLHAIRQALPLLLRPRSAYLHLKWIRNEKRYRRIRRDIIKEFDDAFYLGTYPEVRRLKIGPVRHYIMVGWKEGKDPNELFSTKTYLETYTDVADRGINPFQHYIQHGREEGRVGVVSLARRRTLELPEESLVLPPMPADDAWDAMPRRVIEPDSAPGVNVVIPVYRSLPHVAATLESVLTSPCETPFECLVIDDCSPEPEVSALLRRLADSGHIRLLVNSSNQGFVTSVNIGMAQNTHRDVVLLNADVLVHPGWLDRVVAPLKDDPKIATVTPLSNNATIASYPNFAVDNNFELEVSSAVIDRLAFEANGNKVVDVPTGIGFCMAIRRSVLEEVGDFDAVTFGLGYGEEGDFCMRALKAGMRNVLATGVFVKHYGSTSFGPGASERSERAQAKLAAKHPDYPNRVSRHLNADPALSSRIMLDIARLKESIGSCSIVFFTHTRGGGIETYLNYLRKALISDGLRDVVDRAVVIQTQQLGSVQVSGFGRKQRLPYLPNLESLNIERHKDTLGAIIELLDPELVHMNSFAGLTVPSISRLMEALISSKRPYWHVWHDHQPLCPRLTFLDAEERYCGEQDASRCVACLASTTASFEWVRIEEWRGMFKHYLDHAAVVSAPTESAALRARRLADVSKVQVHPHPELHLNSVVPLKRAPARDNKKPRRVLILGAIGPHKGAFLLSAMVRDMRRRDLPIHLDVLGYTASKEIRTGPNVTLHGRYNGDMDAARRIAAIQPDICLCSSIWPETYVFTISVAMALHLPIATFDIGAQAERAEVYGRAAILGRNLMEDPVGLNDALLEIDLDALWARPADVAFAQHAALSDHFLKQRPAPSLAAAGTTRSGATSADREDMSSTGDDQIAALS
ncbi:glycosyltransferase [Acuticoccus sp. MNP-M23]|uniref:glycosyltransferase family 2 protein n=1 Tax=Acuticoccus sp. MNP-M23 TaxID=3072793 RepID=UPI002815B519|nr:glycosyltransferase [Acuticoccus sp. MNP-M23]WMS42049.1 glycosyltransferase [Acuticoccus sp. MNP-M23]